MAPSTSAEAKATKPQPKKTKSGGANKKKLTPFNKFMKTEMARLKDDEPDITHQERFKLATSNWKTSPLNPKAGK